jgi:hypothetical protein
LPEIGIEDLVQMIVESIEEAWSGLFQRFRCGGGSGWLRPGVEI